MKQKILDYLNGKDAGKYHPLNKLILAVKAPTNREHIAQIKKELQVMVAEGLIEVEENRHLLLDQIDGVNYADYHGNALPKRYYDLSDLNISAKGRGAYVKEAYKPVATPAPGVAQREETYVPGETGAKRADYKEGVIRGESRIDQPRPNPGNNEDLRANGDFTPE